MWLERRRPSLADAAGLSGRGTVARRWLKGPGRAGDISARTGRTHRRREGHEAPVVQDEPAPGRQVAGGRDSSVRGTPT